MAFLLHTFYYQVSFSMVLSLCLFFSVNDNRVIPLPAHLFLKGNHRRSFYFNFTVISYFIFLYSSNNSCIMFREVCSVKAGEASNYEVFKNMQQECSSSGGTFGCGGVGGDGGCFLKKEKKSGPTMHRKVKGSKLVLMKIRNKLFLKSESINKTFNGFSEKFTQLSVSYIGNDTLITQNISFRSDGRRTKKSRVSQMDDYCCVVKENISYAFPWKFTKKKPQKTTFNHNYESFKNNFVEENRSSLCNDFFACTSPNDKYDGGVDSENFKQRHFPANLGDTQLAFYSKINQLKSKRVRLKQFKLKCKNKPSVCAQKHFGTNRNGLKLPIQGLQSEETNSILLNISNCTSDTDPAHHSTNDTDPAKLAKSGDIESNPGPPPINNNVKSTGRPKKNTFPSKSTGISYAEAVRPNESVVDNMLSTGSNSSTSSIIPMMRSRPIGLSNCLENICFLNSVVQVLYFIPELQTKIHNFDTRTLIRPLTTDQHVQCNVITALKFLFTEISNAQDVVKTSNYFNQLLY